MKQKRLMLLGGLRYLIPVIEAAHEQGYYVITADYLPDNIAHKFSDKYCNVSIINKEAVLEKAIELHIDGIMSFACDPGVVTASYIQEKMHLPSFGPFESTVILQNKDKFREFLKKHKFNVPWAFGYDSVEGALQDADKFSYPLIVKPTDSAGSKGVSKVSEVKGLEKAIEHAFKYSIGKKIIAEKFIDKCGASSDADMFIKDGQIQFIDFSAQWFDEQAPNPYTPAAFTWPSTYTESQREYLTSEIQRLVSLLKMKTAVFNVETRIEANGKPYIMEVSPRGGGNRLCEMIRIMTGQDLITAITRYAVGDEPTLLRQSTPNGYWAEIVLHSPEDGIFQKLCINESFNGQIIEKDLWVKKGDKVNSFNGANNTIGTLVLKFNNQEDMKEAISHQNEWLEVLVK